MTQVQTPTASPVLYSFRRCPYAMRARMAIDYSETSIEHREILLKDKPNAMLEVSPKGTVPVLVLPEGKVIDESRDVMMWALGVNDSQHWYHGLNTSQQESIQGWIDRCDYEFKPWLDKYKYAVGYPEQPPEFYRQQGEAFLNELEQALTDQQFLMGAEQTLADNALFPFVRQFAHVDKPWFDQSPYPRLQTWLKYFLSSKRFLRIMKKHPVWQPERHSSSRLEPK